MHSCLVRLQNAFGFFTTVAAFVGVAVALSSLLQPQTPGASVKYRGANVLKGRPHYYSPTKTEYASLRFDLSADFSSLFSWNTKQLFVWVTATYPSTASNATASTELSQAVIWDIIINSPEQEDPPKLWALIGRNAYDPPPGSSGSTKSQTAKQKAKAKADAKAKAKAKAKVKSMGTDSGKLGVLELKDQKPKYKIPDPSGHISQVQNVTLSVGWNVQPWVGALGWLNRRRIGVWEPFTGGQSEAFELPAIKGATGGTAKETVVGRGDVPAA